MRPLSVFILSGDHKRVVSPLKTMLGFSALGTLGIIGWSLVCTTLYFMGRAYKGFYDRSNITSIEHKSDVKLFNSRKEDFAMAEPTFGYDKHYSGELRLELEGGKLVNVVPNGRKHYQNLVAADKPAIGTFTHVSFCHKDVAILREARGDYYWKYGENLFLFNKEELFPLGFVKDSMIVADKRNKCVAEYKFAVPAMTFRKVDLVSEKPDQMWLDSMNRRFTHSVNVFLSRSDKERALMLLLLTEEGLASTKLIRFTNNGLIGYPVPKRYAKAILDMNFEVRDLWKGYNSAEEFSQFANFMELQKA